jgi:hypothetical protein
MADIKQAAKWMQEGKKVRRSTWEAGYCHAPHVKVIDEDDKKTSFFVNELLADDWEIAE